jgi:hypothetical protein
VKRDGGRRGLSEPAVRPRLAVVIRTTMNVYGGAMDDTLREYNGKVVRVALRA